MSNPACSRIGIVPVAVSLLVAVMAAAAELPDDLSRCAELATSGRFKEIIEILGPHESSLLNDEERYVVNAELGRAHFHTGAYVEAHSRFQTAVRLRPQRVETALYLEATAYVTGDHSLALRILDSVLASGARDLWLAVTLPGERRFLADSAVWEVLQRHAVTLPVDPARGRIFDVELGQTRDVVEKLLRVAPSTRRAPILSATAGPETIWAFHFDATERLEQVSLYADHLLRYTPYRVQLGDALDWRATPSSAVEALGQADQQVHGADGARSMSWMLDGARLTLEFSTAPEIRLPVHPPSVELLVVVRLDSP